MFFLVDWVQGVGGTAGPVTLLEHYFVIGGSGAELESSVADEDTSQEYQGSSNKHLEDR
jgi:hypothetical protein